MTSRRPALLRIAVLALAVISASVAIAACGDDDESDSENTAAGATTGTIAGGETISVQSVGGLEALVDADGNVLYTNDQDTESEIACTDECAGIWLPVTTESAQPGSDDPEVEARLSVIRNPDGDNQVAYDGLPLYTFTEDSPGEVTGNGFTDSFGGVTFTWTAATVGGPQQNATTTTETETEPESETTESDDSGGGAGSDDSGSSDSGSGGVGY